MMRMRRPARRPRLTKRVHFRRRRHRSRGGQLHSSRATSTRKLGMSLTRDLFCVSHVEHFKHDVAPRPLPTRQPRRSPMQRDDEMPKLTSKIIQRHWRCSTKSPKHRTRSSTNASRQASCSWKVRTSAWCRRDTRSVESSAGLPPWMSRRRCWTNQSCGCYWWVLILVAWVRVGFWPM